MIDVLPSVITSLLRHVEAELMQVDDGWSVAVTTYPQFDPATMSWAYKIVRVAPGHCLPFGTDWTVYGPMTSETREAARRIKAQRMERTET